MGYNESILIVNKIAKEVSRMKKIILVDDDEFVLEQLVSTVEWEKYGFECAGTFTDGTDALAYISSMPVDAVITDIKMNNMSGLELVEICNKNFAGIKFAVMSAYRDFEYAHKALNHGVTNYILKPIVYDDFIGCLETLAAAVQKSEEEEILSKAPTDAIIAAIAYMNAHLNESLTLNTVAAHIGFSPNYFSNYFKQNTDENFVTFLTKLRVTKAKQLLENTDIKISIICDMVGYKNPTHFYNVFAEYVDGLTPSQYRNLKKKGER